MENKHAIITGDIVSSRKIEPAVREKLYTDLAKFLSTLKGKFLRSYETYRGDSIQCESLSIESSLRLALLIRTYVMSYSVDTKPEVPKPLFPKGYSNSEFDIRLAIGVGEVDFIKRKKISSSDGEAFRLSGEGLDSLKDENERLVFSTGNELLKQDIEPVVVLLDAMAQKWTLNQAQLIFNKLQNKKDEEISHFLKVSLSAVNQRKKTAQWYAIEKALLYFENKLSKII